jgi:thiamine-phosphate pyrophosphorylase
MAPQLYLITPANPDVAQFPRQLMAVLTGPEVAAILVQRGALSDADYAKFVASLVQVGQAAGAAVLVENDAALAKKLDADGVHISTGNVEDIEEAIKLLKPQGIVGAGHIRSRHDAMNFGEKDVDYVFFGPIGDKADPQAADLSAWWAETFEVPAVFSNPSAQGSDAAATLAEFIAVSDSVWSAADPAAALAAIDRALRETE